MERVRKYWKYIVGLMVVLGVTAVGIRYATADDEIRISFSQEDAYEVNQGADTIISYKIEGTIASDIRTTVTVETDDKLGVVAIEPDSETATNQYTPEKYDIVYDGNNNTVPVTGTHNIKASRTATGITKVKITLVQEKEDPNTPGTWISAADPIEKIAYIKSNFTDTDYVPANYLLSLQSSSTSTVTVSGIANGQNVVYTPEYDKVIKVNNDGTMIKALSGGSSYIDITITLDNESITKQTSPIMVEVEQDKTADGKFDSATLGITQEDYFKLYMNNAKSLNSIFNVDEPQAVEWQLEQVGAEPNDVFTNTADGIVGTNYGVAKLKCYAKGDTRVAETYIVVLFSFAAKDRESMNVNSTIQILQAASIGSYSFKADYIGAAAQYVTISADNTLLTANKSGEAEVSIKATSLSNIYREFYESTEPGSTAEDTPGVYAYTKRLRIIIIDALSLDKNVAYVSVDGTIDLYASVTNTTSPVIWSIGDGSGKYITFEDGSLNQTTSISEDGKRHKVTIKGIKMTGLDNVATVTATQTSDGVAMKATCTFTVGNPVMGIEIKEFAQSPVVGGTIELEAQFLDNAEPYNKNLKWTSSNETIATVTPHDDNPRLCTVTFPEGSGGGYVTITVIAEDGLYSDSVTLDVKQPLTGITIDQGDSADVDFRVGTMQLSATITPLANGNNGGITWSSSNEDLATVDQNGLVTFIKPGEKIVITATANGTLADGKTRPSDSITLNVTQPVTNITLDYTELTLRIGFGQLLSATVEPDNATNKRYKFTSTDTSVATVDESTGYVTAVNSGTCNIRCDSEDGNYTAICTVTVVQPVLSVSLSESQMTVVKGTYFWLSATVSPDNANNKQVNWVSSNSEICTVGSDGQCVAVAAGKCTISAVSLDSGVAGYCEVTVTEPVTGILLNTYSENMIAGNKLMLLPTVLPVEATNKNVTYVSSDPSVATVDVNGIVTAVAGGSCSIKVTTEERQLTAVCNITVKEYVSSITLDRTQAYLNYGASMQLAATVAKETATDKGVTWSSNNPGIISVDQAGVVRAVNYGTAVISVVANDGGGAVGTCTITVIKPVTEIGLDRRKVTIIVGETVYVTPTVYPSDATIQGVTWSSSDSNIATVDFDGQVTGMAVGKCEVTATSTDGNNVRSSCIVTVVPAISASGVKINSDDLVMLRGKTRTLKARLTPGNSTEGINWVSSDTSVVVVDGNGTISTVGPGVAEVTAYSSVTGTEDSCKISVIQMNSTAISLEQYDTYNLFVDYAPDKTISWRTSNNRVATISQSGLVTARKPGTCTIYATIEGKTVSCTVTVVALKR